MQWCGYKWAPWRARCFPAIYGGGQPIVTAASQLRSMALPYASLLPVLWMLIPRGDGSSLYVALGIVFLQGVADMGWGIGSGRLLYVSVVPPEKRSDYMALYYAFTGIVGGISQLSGGRLLDASQSLSGKRRHLYD